MTSTHSLACDQTAESRRKARRRWPQVPRTALETVACLVEQYQFSISNGDLAWIDRGWYVTHSGLLALASRRNCAGIEVHPVVELCDPKNNRWVFAATVYPTRHSKGFSGFGDADPANVGEVVRGAELRIAETRAVNRALRKAYGVGLCSVEELGSRGGPPENAQARRASEHCSRPTLEIISNPPLRDQLRQLIREHGLDPTQTKSYSLTYLGVPSLRQATREQVGSLLAHLQQRLFEDREAFLAELLETQAPQEAA